MSAVGHPSKSMKMMEFDAFGGARKSLIFGVRMLVVGNPSKSMEMMQFDASAILTSNRKEGDDACR